MTTWSDVGVVAVCADGSFGVVDLLTGVVVGVAAAVVWASLTEALRWWRLRGDFGWLAGTYSSTKKQTEQPDPETVSITVKENILRVEFLGLPDGSSVHGKIAMNEQLPTSGKGHYLHHFTNGTRGWGFWDAQASEELRMIVVNTTYAGNTPLAVVQGYEWRRIEGKV
jgi:hypothetical protein